MTWIKQNDNQYIHDQAPYSLVLSNGIWSVIDNRDQSKSIPFDDILNNPVFPADFSNQTILARHFRGQATGDLASPPHSFQGEINSGLYRESAGVLAISSLGNKVLTINSIPSFLAKAWVNFNGSLSAANMILGSGNVSSITDNGTGDYTINFTIAMSTANYAAIVSGTIDQAASASPNFAGILARFGVVQIKTVSQIQLLTQNFVGTATDCQNVNMAVFE